jgi:hypothetical protein
MSSSANQYHMSVASGGRNTKRLESICDSHMTSCEAHVDFYVGEHATWCPPLVKKRFCANGQTIKKRYFS